MREIGSEFWNVPTAAVKNAVFDDNTQWYLSGRAALSAVIRDILRGGKIRRVLLPSWCCDSMIAPFVAVGAEINFYDVLPVDGKVVIDYPKNVDADVMVVMDYFGYYSAPVPNNNCFIIRDVTHSVFSRDYDDADYCFGSLRKWAGFYSGGFAIKRNGRLPNATEQDNRFIGLRRRAMEMKSAYIKGETDDKSYLNIFAQAEKILDNSDKICRADSADVERAEHLDVNFIKSRRRDNADILLSRLSDFSLFSLKDGDCPLFVPISLPNRDEVKAQLISHAVYCPCHWGVSDLHVLSRDQKRIYESELSLVCDQRYDGDDMRRICDIVERVAKAC